MAVTEAWQLFVSDGSAVDTAFVAFLTALEQWTQPLKPGAVDTAFGAWRSGHSLLEHCASGKLP